MAKKHSKPETAAHSESAEESNATRERLLLAAAEAFGSFGYDGASVRTITIAAGANIQAVAYYFGGKEGLYLAVADHLAIKIKDALRASVGGVSEIMDNKPDFAAGLDAEAAADLLRRIFRHLVSVMLKPELKPLAQFMIREQINGTAGFTRVYENAVGPLFDLCAKLIAILQGGANPASRKIRLRTFSAVGSIMVFRIGYATLMRQLGKDELEKSDKRDIDRLMDDLVRSLHSEKGGQ